MQVSTLSFKNFRCFSHLDLTFNSSCIVVSGGNGTGKTTLLEGLYYLCYLRSFRTHTPKELIRFEQNHFFVRAQYLRKDSDEQHCIQAGFTGAKRLVRVDNRSVCSYKELMSEFCVIALTEDDVNFVKGGPEQRRAFIDHALIVKEPSTIQDIKAFKSILLNRNMLLKSHTPNQDSYDIWTAQLVTASEKLQRKRKALLKALSDEVNGFIKQYFETDMSITIVYKKRKQEISKELKNQEYQWGRSLFGAHLDDFVIQFKEKLSRTFASRGQQKLIIFLLKLAQIKVLTKGTGSCIFLVDDFLTDFDEVTIERLLKATFSIPGQKIFTLPAKNPFFEDILRKQVPFQSVNLTN